MADGEGHRGGDESDGAYRSPSGEVEIEMHSKKADGTVLNNIFLTGTIQNGSMTAKGAFQMGRKVTLDWHKN